LEEHFDLRSLGYEQNACQVSNRHETGLLLTDCLGLAPVEQEIWWELANSGFPLSVSAQHLAGKDEKKPPSLADWAAL
jgi:hypothetical protein